MSDEPLPTELTIFMETMGIRERVDLPTAVKGPKQPLQSTPIAKPEEI